MGGRVNSSKTESAVFSVIQVGTVAVADERKDKLNISTSQIVKVTHEGNVSKMSVKPHVAYRKDGKVVKRTKSTKRQDSTQVLQDGQESRD